MSTSLYRTYRPMMFSEIIGQQHIVQTLSNSILHDRISHAYLFTGPRGTGKTTMARIFAKAVNCKNKDGANPCNKCDICTNINEGKSLDIYEIDAASNTGVDNIRELRENVKFPPSQATFKVYIIDEVHMLSTGAFNALLKTLEEPPSHVIFILATTEIHKVPQTIISRCQRFDFTRISIEHLIKKLSRVAKSEEIVIDKEALEMIAIASEGGMRDAESLLAQVIAFEDKNITAKEVQEILGTTQRIYLEQMAQFLLDKKLSEALLLIDNLAKDGFDLDVFHKTFLNYLRQLLLLTVDQSLIKTFAFELTSEQAKDLAKQSEGHSPQELIFIITCYTDIQGKIKSSFIPQLPLELATVRAIQKISSTQPQQQISATIPSSTTKPATLVNNDRSQNIPSIPVSEKKPLEPVMENKVEPIKKPEVQEKEIQEEEKSLPTIDTKAPEGFSLYDVQKNWTAISAEIIMQNHSLATLLPGCTVASVSGNTVTLATKYPFHKDKLKEIPNQLTVEAAFAKILGFPIRINAVTMQEVGIDVPRPAPSRPGENISEKPRETSSLLSDAMGIMGGTIVE